MVEKTSNLRGNCHFYTETLCNGDIISTSWDF